MYQLNHYAAGTFVPEVYTAGLLIVYGDNSRVSAINTRHKAIV